MSTRNEPCHLFVGIGGTGGKTISALAELFAANGAWRSRAYSSLYFVLADTDLSDLRGSKKKIEDAFSDQVAPYVATFELSQNVIKFPPFAAARLLGTAAVDDLDPEARAGELRERAKAFADVWWWREHEGKTEPFTAKNMQSPVAKGAGQCPSLAYLLAWNRLDEDGADGGWSGVVLDVIEVLRKRFATAYGEAPLQPHVHLVTGLAGGTGRGCWALLALKLKEVFAAQGIVVSVDGIFFDQSCFAEVKADYPSQVTKLRVNALTGLSELTAWINNDRQTGEPSYWEFRLPSLRQPRIADLSVILPGRIVKQGYMSRGASPVDRACLLFDESPAGEPLKTENDAKYRLAAGVLYGTAVESRVSQVGVNDNQDFTSAGAASIEIPVQDLRKWLRIDVERAIADRFARQPRAEDVRDRDLWRGKDAQQRPCFDAGTLAGDMAQVLVGGLTPIIDRHTVLLKDPRARREGDTPTNGLLDELASIAFKCYDEQLRRVPEMPRAAFLAQGDLAGTSRVARVTSDVQSVVRCVQRGACDLWARQHMANEVQDEFWKAGRIEDVDDTIARFLWRRAAFPVELSGCKPITLHLEWPTFMASLLRAMADRLERAFADELFIMRQREETRKVFEAKVDKINKRFRQPLLGGLAKKVSAEQASDLDRDGRAFLGWETCLKVTTGLRARYRGAARRLREMAENLDQCADRAKRHQDDCNKRQRESGSSGPFMTRERLRDLQPEPRMTVTRYLHPVRTGVGGEEDSFVRAAVDANMSGEAGRAQKSLRDAAWNLAAAENALKREEHLRDISERFDSLSQHVRLDEDAFERAYSFKSVLVPAVNFWFSELQGCKGKIGADYERVKLHFIALFGQKALRMCEMAAEARGRVQVEAGTPTSWVSDNAKTLERLYASMAVHMGGSTRPRVIIEVPQGERPRLQKTYVFWPKGVPDSDAASLRDVEREHSVGIDPDRDNNGNPYCMLAFVREPLPHDTNGLADFDQVMSMRDWKDAGLELWLRSVEMPTGESLWLECDHSFGLGYTLPAFVRCTDKSIYRDRWRPWTRKPDLADPTPDLLLHGLLGAGSRTGLPPVPVPGVSGSLDVKITSGLFRVCEGERLELEFVRDPYEFKGSFWEAASDCALKGKRMSLRAVVARLRDVRVRNLIARECAAYWAAAAHPDFPLRDADVKAALAALKPLLVQWRESINSMEKDPTPALEMLAVLSSRRDAWLAGQGDASKSTRVISGISKVFASHVDGLARA